LTAQKAADRGFSVSEITERVAERIAAGAPDAACTHRHVTSNLSALKFGAAFGSTHDTHFMNMKKYSGNDRYGVEYSC